MSPESTSSESFPVESIGGAHQQVGEADFIAFVERNLARADVDGKKVVLVVPDGTRSMPLPMVLKAVHAQLAPRVAELTAVIALGTHSYMEPDEIDRWFGVGGEGQPATLEEAYPGMRVVNHEWQDPDKIVKVGTLSAETIRELSQGAQDVSVDVEINRYVVEADVNIVIGPVFPHEVVGISGGNKYFIPGCATHDAIDLSHWVGALLGVEKVIGTTGITPMRAIINAGTDLIDNEKLALCLVVQSGSGELEAAAFGTSEDAWAAMAEVAAESHIVWLDEPLQKVIACMPERYDDIWTAAKGCYKAQPAMADGGEVIIYAPHVTEVSEVHHEIYEIGYHCIEYFTKQWDRFQDVPKGVLAHSTHVRGAGTYDEQTGTEHNRIKVTLATQITPETCAQVNLGYLDPASIDLEAEAKTPGTMVVPNAGEILFKLNSQR
ncbi:lactate racemase domain-containing protein [Luteococcus sp. Sow4_B9]|uniref:lactate racemase domain-containing protein n=1 Tax=Luteococcus sp. Sow4_B9 TaxID=3438792 RepID=UPI003F9E1719